MPPVRATALALLLGAAGLCGFARGGLPLPAQAAAGAACAAALLLAALGERRGRPLRPGPAFLAPLLVLAVAALQCLPLPAALLRALSPAGWELRSFPPAPVPAFAPLSLDRAATLAALCPAAAVACALAAAGLLGRHPKIRRLLLALPVAAALAHAGIALVRLAGGGPFAAGFVNRNHFAALLLLGALCALGAALGPGPPESDRPVPQRRLARAAWAGAGGLCAACALLTLSRGASLSLAAGAALLLLGGEPGRPASRRVLLRRGAIGAVLAAALVAALLLAPTGAGDRWLGVLPERLGSEVKLRSFAGALRVALEHPLTGVGRGAWRFLSERHRSVPGEFELVYVENEPLQLAAEEGLPAAAAVLLLSLAALLLAWRRAGDGLARGALAGAFALGLHNLVDFNLSLPGVALPLAVTFGAACALEPAEREAAEEEQGRLQRLRRLRLPRAAVALLGAAALAAAALALEAGPRQADAEAERMLGLVHDRSVSAPALLEAAAEAVGRHPADWLLSLAPAIGLHLRAPPMTGAALAWAGRAQHLAPEAWRPHAVAAAVLARAGHRSQARLEARLALAASAGVYLREPLELAMDLSGSLDELLEATPDDPFVRARLAEHLRARGRSREALALVDAELARLGAGQGAAAGGGPASPEVQELRATRAHTLLALGDLAGAEAEALRLGGSGCGSLAIRAEAGTARRDPPALLEPVLREGLAACPGERRLAELLVRGRLGRGDAAGALALLDEPAVGGPAVAWAADVHLWRAEALEEGGHATAGLAERWFAAQRAPERADLGIDYAERLRARGDLPRALAALRTLALQAPPEARARLEQRLVELEKLRR